MNTEVSAAHPDRSLYAVIEVGTTSIRMVIAEVDVDGNIRSLERLAQAVAIGRDTFAGNAIRKSTVEECVRVLESYARLLDEYQLRSTEKIRVVATSAVREASNRLAFLDRVYVATGFQIEPLDEADVNRVTYLGVQPHLRREPALSRGMTVIMEAGGGSTELLIVQDEDVLFAHSYRLGSLRLRKMLDTYRTPPYKSRKIMESQIQRTMDELRESLTPGEHVELIAIGGDMRFAAGLICEDWDRDSMAQIQLDAFARFTDQILALSEDELIQRYHLSVPEAETLGPALLAYLQAAKTLKLSRLWVTNTNLRDGLLHELSAGTAWTDEFRNQIIRSALSLGRRFDFDEPHAWHVAQLSQKLFTELASQHQLDHRYEVVLYVAALLHEVGTFISHRSMHKHSMYLIRNSEIFGLGKRELLLVALVARYHRRASPQPNHDGYQDLSREERIAVSKMAALLRVAVALDDSRSQRVQDFRINIERGKLVLSIGRVEDLSLEQLALRQSGSLFEEIFGLPVHLRVLPE